MDGTVTRAVQWDEAEKSAARQLLPEARTVVIWNPSAGSVDQAAAVREQLEALTQVTLREPAGREETIKEVARAVEDGAEMIVAAGGDGTVNAVVSGLMDAPPGPILGLLPLGTGNDLARSLEIPLAPEEALGTLMSGRICHIDTVQLTSTHGPLTCANMLTAGNTGRFLRQMTSEMKRRWGPFCYVRGVIDVIRDLETFQIEIRCDDGPPESFEALNVFVANGRFSGGGMPVSPDALLDDGYVDIVIVQDGDAGEIASLTSQYVLSDYLQHELVAFRRARQVTVTSQPAMPLTADGDEVGETPLSVVVRPQSLPVLVPNEVEE